MANYFEHIDDYLTDRLSAEERVSFETQLSKDVDLMDQVRVQRDIIQVVQQKRVQQLKNMLNSVPVSSFKRAKKYWWNNMSNGSLVVAGTGIVMSLLGVYYYFNSSTSTPETPSFLTQKDPTHSNQTKENPSFESTHEAFVDSDEEQKDKPSSTKEETGVFSDPRDRTTKKKNEVGKIATPTQKQDKFHAQTFSTHEISTPSIEVPHLTEDTLTKNQVIDLYHISPEDSQNSMRPVVGDYSNRVEVRAAHKKHSFHYLFKDSKLILYGDFKHDLYEIIEIDSSPTSLFLCYGNKYYFLDPQVHTATILEPIKDKKLINRLRKFQN